MSKNPLIPEIHIETSEYGPIEIRLSLGVLAEFKKRTGHDAIRMDFGKITLEDLLELADIAVNAWRRRRKEPAIPKEDVADAIHLGNLGAALLEITAFMRESFPALSQIMGKATAQEPGTGQAAAAATDPLPGSTSGPSGAGA